MLGARGDGTLFGWLLYDWANSAYVTTVAVAVLPAYFAAAVVPSGGWTLGGVAWSATTLWGVAVSLAAAFVFLLAPFLGAVADFAACRVRFLAFFCATGAVATVLLFFCGPGMVLPTLALFFVAQVGFVGGNVFYDALLPHVAAPHAPALGAGAMDTLSGRGFAYGYLGGGLQFGLSLALIALHGSFGLGEGQAARIAMASAGLWWGGFALVALRRIGEPSAARVLPPGQTYARLAASRVRATIRTILVNRPLGLFLLAFLCYNDGIQTAISMATIYGKEELGLSTTTLMATLLMIQFVGIGGAELFSAVARRIGTRRGLMLALVCWTGVAAYAYTMRTAGEYVALGAAVGLVLGGSQALSRSLYAAMIPKEQAAEYFAYFSVVNKFSSILGPLLFAVLRHNLGSSRPAILALTFFFAIGFVLLHALGKQRATAQQKM